MSKHENGFSIDRNLKQLTTNVEFVKEYNIKDAKRFGRFVVDAQLILDMRRYKKERTELQEKVNELTNKLINYAAMIESITEQMKTGE